MGLSDWRLINRGLLRRTLGFEVISLPEQDAERMGEPVAKLRESLEKHSGREALQAQMVRERSLDYLTSVANIQTPGEQQK